jgi:hypothetical protein
MAHYAFLDTNNRVTEVIVGVQETELIEGKTPEEFYSTFRNQTCVRTSYNGNIRKQYAGIGYTYDAVNDVFICPQPYGSWILDDNFDWQPPTPVMPVRRCRRQTMYAWFEPEMRKQWIELA